MRKAQEAYGQAIPVDRLAEPDVADRGVNRMLVRLLRASASALGLLNMGYSKYAEDIERSRSMNIFGTVLDGQPSSGSTAYRCDFCSFETYDRERRDEHILKEHREAAIYLEYNDQVVPNRAVFKVRPIELKIRCPALPRGIEVSVSSRSQARSNRRFQEGDLLQITPTGEELFSLQLGVSSHRRHYDISFRHQTLAAKWTLGLLGELKSANSRISGWGESDLSQFEAVLLGEPGMNQDDRTHRRGLFAYYHGLWLEQNRKLEYAKRFQEAFNVCAALATRFRSLSSATFGTE